MVTRNEIEHLTKQQRDDMAEEINGHLVDYLSTKHGVYNPTGKNFRCVFCDHADTARVYTEPKQHIKCWSTKGDKHCDGASHDLIELIRFDRGLDYFDALAYGIDLYGIPLPISEKTQGSYARSNQGAAAPEQKTAQQPKKKAPNTEGIRKFVEQAAHAIEGSKAADYMNGRGFDTDFLREMRIGYDEYNNAVVIPYSKEPNPDFDYYTMRYLVPKTGDDGKAIRYYKPGGLTEPIFHADNLTNGMPYVFVTEGQIDALSIEQAGGNAVAIGSCTNGNKLLDYLKQLQSKDSTYKYQKTFIITFDHDDAGIPAEKKLIEDLSILGFTAVSANNAGLYDDTDKLTTTVKDVNELLQADPEALTHRIEKLISKPADVYRDSFSMGSFRSKYQEQRKENSIQPVVSTGFPQLDTALQGGFRAQLIFLGANTSIGKTTIVMQMADNLAQQGRDVIIFALEMSRFELVTRSISRESYRIAKAYQTPQTKNALTFYEISDGRPLTADKINILSQAEDYYFTRIAPRIFIVEGEGNVTTDMIRQQVQTHTELTGAAPAVIVDYLQLLQPPAGSFRLTEKQVVDKNTMELKHISRDFSIPVIGVLSLNRDSYDKDVSLSSGKESGAIEYGCDILLGMNEGETNNDDMIRSIYIDILKNRSGKKNTRITFEYVSAYSFFKDKGVYPLQKKKKSDDGNTEKVKKGERDSRGYMRV